MVGTCKFFQAEQKQTFALYTFVPKPISQKIVRKNTLLRQVFKDFYCALNRYSCLGTSMYLRRRQLIARPMKMDGRAEIGNLMA